MTDGYFAWERHDLINYIRHEQEKIIISNDFVNMQCSASSKMHQFADVGIAFLHRWYSELHLLSSKIN